MACPRMSLPPSGDILCHALRCRFPPVCSYYAVCNVFYAVCHVFFAVCNVFSLRMIYFSSQRAAEVHTLVFPATAGLPFSPSLAIGRLPMTMGVYPFSFVLPFPLRVLPATACFITGFTLLNPVIGPTSSGCIFSPFR